MLGKRPRNTAKKNRAKKRDLDAIEKRINDDMKVNKMTQRE